MWYFAACCISPLIDVTAEYTNDPFLLPAPVIVMIVEWWLRGCLFFPLCGVISPICHSATASYWCIASLHVIIVAPACCSSRRRVCTKDILHSSTTSKRRTSPPPFECPGGYSRHKLATSSVLLFQLYTSFIAIVSVSFFCRIHFLAILHIDVTNTQFHLLLCSR